MSRFLVPARALTVVALGMGLMGSSVATASGASAYGVAAAGRAVMGTTATWGPERRTDRPPWARSTRGTTTYLHSAYRKATDRGLTYARSADYGATWSLRRLSRTGEASFGVGIAAAGPSVHVVWRVTPGDRRDPPIAVYARTSTAYGDATSWLPRRRLPVLRTVTSVAASGSTVVVTGTPGKGPRRWFAVVSHDRGRTWAAKRLAVPAYGEVFSAVASGRTVALTYRMYTRAARGLPMHRVVAVIVSRDKGRTWGAPRVLGRGINGMAAALGTRVVVAGVSSSTAIWVRTWRAGRWGAVRWLHTRILGFDPRQIALRGRSEVGFLATWYSSQGVGRGQQILWRQSGDDGRTWSAYEQVTTTPGQDEATGVIWRSNGQLIAVWDRQGADAGTYLRIRS